MFKIIKDNWVYILTGIILMGNISFIIYDIVTQHYMSIISQVFCAIVWINLSRIVYNKKQLMKKLNSYGN